MLLRRSPRRSPAPVRGPSGAVAEAEVGADRIRVRVACGDPLDEVVLRSYCTGAAHMALGWVTSEALAVDDDGVRPRPHDPVVRRAAGPWTRRRSTSRSIRTPGEPVNGSDAVFAAVAAAVWIDARLPAGLADPRSATMTNPSGLPYTPAVRAGDWLVVSGQIGFEDGALVPGGFEAELRQTLPTWWPAWRSTERPLDQVAKTTVFMADLDDYAQMNEIYGAAFPEPPPGTIGIRRGPPAVRRPGGDRGVGLAGRLTGARCGSPCDIGSQSSRFTRRTRRLRFCL